MAIPFVDLSRQFEENRPELSQAMARVAQRGQYILGPELAEFEKETARYLGVPHAVGVASGTEAIFLTLKALGIGPSDEVLTTPFSFIAGAAMIAALGAHPVFSDIDPVSFNLDPSRLKGKITKRTKAVLVAHIFGFPADLKSLAEFCKTHGIFLIEDACQSFGSSYEGKKVGSFGEAGCFSFYPTKNLGGLGDGGIIVTSNASLALRLRTLRNHGSLNGEDALQLGFNSRLDEIQAAVLRVKLRYIDDWNNKRGELAGRYQRHLRDLDIQLPALPSHSEVACQNYTIRSKRRDKIRQALAEKNIGSMIYYPKPTYQIPSIRTLLKEPLEPLSQVEQACREVLTLPLYPQLTETEVDEVCQVVRDAAK